ncbi:MAG: tyrosine-type recombinase/integrase [Prolixibacteraceae bacterium]|nr:tyrosine-type recombinase/integrase [Prolixibacteraceae bacterium]
MNYQESFLNYLKYEKRFSPHTLVAYKKDLGQFVLYCTEMSGDFNVKEVNSKLIRDWVVALMECGLTPRSVNRKVSTLKSFFKYLLKEDVVSENPVIHIPLPKIRKKLPGFIEEENLNHLLDDGLFEPDFAGTRDKLIIALLYGTGIRLSEMLNLKDNDINTKEYLIKVLGKRNKERIIPYPRGLNRIISDYQLLRQEKFGSGRSFLLLTDKGEEPYPKLIYRAVKNNLNKVTTLEKKSPHVLRHTYATHLLNRGADLNAVKELLGHTNLAATQVYTHTTFEKLQSVYKQTHPRG